jgi:hypothetical protein
MSSRENDDLTLEEYEFDQEDDCDGRRSNNPDEDGDYLYDDEYSDEDYSSEDDAYMEDYRVDTKTGADFDMRDTDPRRVSSVEYLHPRRSSVVVGSPEWEAYKQGYRDGAVDALGAVAREIVTARSGGRIGVEQKIAIEDRQRRQVEERNSTLRMLDRLFAGITERLEDVRRMSDHTQGIWIFKSHVYSESDLLQNPVFSEIYSKCGTFEDILSRQAEGVDPVVRATYASLKSRILSKASEVVGYIQSRRSYGWEIVCTFLNGLFRAAVQYLTGTIVPRIAGW